MTYNDGGPVGFPDALVLSGLGELPPDRHERVAALLGELSAAGLTLTTAAGEPYAPEAQPPGPDDFVERDGDERFVSLAGLTRFVELRTDYSPRYAHGFASQIMGAFSECYMWWARTDHEVQTEGARASSTGSVAGAGYNAWHESGLKMVSRPGRVEGVRSFLVGEERVTALGPTLQSLYVSLKERRIFAILNISGGKANLLIDLVNEALNPDEPLKQVPKAEATKLSERYARQSRHMPPR